MQIRFAIGADLRRKEFVERALLHPPVLLLDVEPHLLTELARETLAQCNPALPETFDLPSRKAAVIGPIDAAQLWAITVSPNAYASAEIAEMWAKELNGEAEPVFAPHAATPHAAPASAAQTNPQPADSAVNGTPVTAKVTGADDDLGDWNPFGDGTFE